MRSGSIIRSLMICCLIMLLVPIIMSGFIYRYASQQISGLIIENNKAVLSQAKSSLEERLASFDNIVLQLSQNKIIPYFTLRIEDDVQYRVWQLCKDLKPIIATESFVSDIYLFFDEHELVVTNNTAYKMDHFYDAFFSVEGMSEADFFSMIRNAGSNSPTIYAGSKVNSHLKSDNRVLYCKAIPANASQKHSATVMLLIDESKLKGLLSEIELYGDGYAYIMDGQGQLITSVQGQSAHPVYDAELPMDGVSHSGLNGKGMTFVSLSSPGTVWRLVAAISTQNLLRSARHIQLWSLLISVVSLALGLVVAYMLLLRRMHPLKSVISRLSDIYQDEPYIIKKPFLYMQEKVYALAEDNERLQDSLDYDQQQLKAMCLRSLLLGNYGGTTAMLERFGIAGSWFNAAVITVEPKENSEKGFGILKTLEPDCLEGDFHVIRHGVGVFYALLCYNQTTPAECIKQASNCMDQAAEKLREAGLGMRTFCGRFCNLPAEASLSFYDALDMSRASNFSGDAIFWYDDLDRNDGAYFYPVETEAHLVEQLRVGNTSAVSALLDRIYSDNFKFGKLSTEMKRRLFEELQGTLIKVSGSMQHQIENEAELDFDELFVRLRKVFLKLSEMNLARISQQDDIGTRMLRYIDEHYHESGLSIKHMAQVFGLSESYLSKYFKANTGFNFSVYLENVRIRQANKMLKHGGVQIKEIAKRVGYLDDKSFRRAYKRRLGIAPGECQ